MSTAGADLDPYIPRLILDWVAESPDETARLIPGTLVFVDISGFTKLSERLARRGGRAGAEDLTAVLDTTFSQLLSDAASYGGSMLKYGGDALLIFFWGDAHPLRGAAAAAHMRTSLRAQGAIATPAGTVVLRMSVGVHTGDFNFFLVGSSHRELIVAGPAATKTVAMESAASAGQILVSEETAQHLGGKHLGRSVGNGRLLLSAPPVSPSPPVPAPAGVAADPLVPSLLRDHLAAGGHVPEHRQVAVAFTHFLGLDSLIETEGPASAAVALEHLMGIVQRVFGENEICFLSTDIYDDGGKFISLAGAPRAGDDDDERLLRAIRSVHDAADGPLTLRSGVHRGAVFAGDIGPSFRRTYTVMGDAVNTAARVMARAEPGQMLATPAVLERSLTVFELADVEPFAAKGKAKPLSAAVVGPTVSRHGRTLTSAPFTGRDEELGRFRDALRQLAGGGATFAVSAPPGAGKSRLLAEVASIATSMGIEVITASADRYESTTPYAAARPLLWQAVGLAPGDADADQSMAEAIGSSIKDDQLAGSLLRAAVGIGSEAVAVSEDLDPRSARFRLQQGVAALIRRYRSAATVFVLEDVHWADEGSLDVLGALAEHAPGEQWLVIAAARPSDSRIHDLSGVHVMTLEPLAVDDSARLASALVPGGLLPDQAARIAERAGGNPLFLEELARGVAAGNDVDTLPETVEGIFAAEIDRLPPRSRTLLRYAAVLGQSFQPELLARASGERLTRGWWRTLGGALEAGDDGSLSFRHALFRDTAYEGLSYRLRRDIHRRVGVALEDRADADPAVLSLHFSAAAEWSRSWKYSVAAAADAERRFANAAAADLLDRALVAAGHLGTVPNEEVAAAYERLGVVADRLGHIERAARAFRAARRITDDQIVAARLLFCEGQMRERKGSFSQALRYYSRGLTALSERHDAASTAQRARLLLARGQIALHRYQCARAVRLAEEAERLAIAIDDEKALAQAHIVLYGAHLNLGTVDRARYRDVPLRVYERHAFTLGLLSILNMAAADDYMTGNWHAALQGYDRGRQLADETGYTERRAEAVMNAGELLADQGRWSLARERLEEANAYFLPAAHRRLLSFTRIQLARTMAAQGSAAEGCALLDTTADELAELGVKPWEVLARARRLEITLAADPDADVTADAAALDASASGVPGAATALAIALRAGGVSAALRGDPSAAAEFLASAVERARADSSIYEWAVTLDVWHALGPAVAEPPPAPVAEVDESLAKLGVVDHLLRRVVPPR